MYHRDYANGSFSPNNMLIKQLAIITSTSSDISRVSVTQIQCSKIFSTASAVQRREERKCAAHREGVRAAGFDGTVARSNEGT
jgi:hypothetical protein